MKAIKPVGGVYVLVLYLPVKKTITAGGAGTHTFEKGWHTYCGTAHGSGGLRARLTRHIRRLGENKKPKWQIDYVREHATIEEIWCAELPAEAECRWSRALSRLSDTSVPVKGLGSTDCNVCPAHFYRLRQRLPGSLMRSIAGAKDDTLMVIEVEPWNRNCKTKLEWESDYWEGRQILERVRFEYWSQGEVHPTNLSLLGRKSVLRELISGPQSKRLHKAVKFAHAVDTLIETHGEWAHRVIFDPTNPQTRGDILAIARKSWERQHERITQVSVWGERSIGPQKGDSSQDTMNFAKILTRIGRAKGAVRIASGPLRSQLADLDNEQVDCIKSSVAMYRSELATLVKHVRKLEVFEGDSSAPKYRRRKMKSATNETKLLPRCLPRQLKSGLSMLVKTNKDIPRSHYDLRPSHEQKQRAANELGQVQTMVKELEIFLAREAV